MLTSPGAIYPAGSSRIQQYKSTERTKPAQAAPAGKYDSVSFSGMLQQEGNRYMDVVGRLTQEVRATTTTGEVRALHDEVASGQYTVDAMRIAGRMLFLTDEE